MQMNYVNLQTFYIDRAQPPKAAAGVVNIEA